MDETVLDGGFAVPAHDAARAFRAAMEAMARPGTIQPITGATPPAPLSPAAGALILSLCDPGTPVFLAGAHNCDAVRQWITFQTGAPFCGPAECDFAVGLWADLCPLEDYRIGTADYPDRSATLIVEVGRLTQTGTRLAGPGIKDEAELSLPNAEMLAQRPGSFPLGIDMFLTHGSNLAAIPRTTRTAQRKAG